MASRKKAGKRKGSSAPAGFVKVEGPHIAGFWVPEIVGQSVQGIVGELITTTGKDNKPNTYCQLTLTANDGGPVYGLDESKRKRKVDVGEGMIIGVGGAALLPMLRTREREEVLIVFTGMGEKKAGKSPARLFDVFVRE